MLKQAVRITPREEGLL